MSHSYTFHIAVGLVYYLVKFFCGSAAATQIKLPLRRTLQHSDYCSSFLIALFTFSTIKPLSVEVNCRSFICAITLRIIASESFCENVPVKFIAFISSLL